MMHIETCSSMFVLALLLVCLASPLTLAASVNMHKQHEIENSVAHSQSFTCESLLLTFLKLQNFDDASIAKILGLFQTEVGSATLDEDPKVCIGFLTRLIARLDKYKYLSDVPALGHTYESAENLFVDEDDDAILPPREARRVKGFWKKRAASSGLRKFW